MKHPQGPKLCRPVALAAAALMLSACANFFSDDFVRQMDDAYYSKWPQDIKAANFGAHSLGQNLQPYFRDHARACGMFSTLGTGFPADRNYIPSEIQDYTGTSLNTPVTTIPEVMGENIFYYAFPALDPDKPATQLNFQPLFDVDEAGLWHTFGLSHDYPVLPERGIESWRIRQSCAGFLNSHLAASYDGKGSPPFIPYGAFKAAVQNDKEMKSSIVGVSGRFTSPLASLLAADDISPDAINVKLNLWYKYRRAAADGTLTNLLEQTSLIRDFRGLLISRATSKEDITNLNASGVLTLDLKSVAGLGAEARLDSKFGIKNTFQSSRYNTLIYCNDQKDGNPVGCQLRAMSLPSPEQLAGSFGRVNPDGGKDAFSSIQPNRTIKFWQDVAGIPAKFCNRNEQRWELAFTKNGEIFAPGLIPTLIPSPLEKDGVQKCRFAIEGRIRGDLDVNALAAGNDRVEIGFDIRNRDTLSYAGKTQQLRFPGKIAFGVKNQLQPVIIAKEPLSYDKVGSDPQNQNLQWEFDVVMSQQNNAQIINFTHAASLSGGNTRLTRFSENRFEEARDEYIDVRTRLDPDGRKFFHVTVRNSRRFDFSNPQAWFDEQYTLRTELKVPLTNGDIETVPIEIRLAYPSPKALPSAAPIPEETPRPRKSREPKEDRD